MLAKKIAGFIRKSTQPSEKAHIMPDSIAAGFLSSADLRRRLKLGKTALYELRRRDRSFPKPIRWLGGQDRFALAEVEEWERAQFARRDAAE